MALLPWLLRASRGRRGACLRPRRSTPLPLILLCHRRAGRDISRSANNSAGVCATQSSISCVCPWRPKSRAWSSKPSRREFDFVERRTDLLVVDSAPVHLNGAAPQAPATARRGGACRSALPPRAGAGAVAEMGRAATGPSKARGLHRTRLGEYPEMACHLNSGSSQAARGRQAARVSTSSRFRTQTAASLPVFEPSGRSCLQVAGAAGASG